MNDYEDKMSLICGFCFSSYVSPKAATFSSALPNLRKRGKGGLTKEILGVMMCVRDVVFHPGEEVRVYTDKLALVVFFHTDPQRFFFSSLGCVKPFGTSPIQSLVLSYEDMHTTYSYTKTHTKTNTLVLSLSLEWLVKWITMPLSTYKQNTFIEYIWRKPSDEISVQ